MLRNLEGHSYRLPLLYVGSGQFLAPVDVNMGEGGPLFLPSA